MWQAEGDKELTLSASPVTAVGDLALTLANWRHSTALSKDVPTAQAKSDSKMKLLAVTYSTTHKPPRKMSLVYSFKLLSTTKEKL